VKGRTHHVAAYPHLARRSELDCQATGNLCKEYRVTLSADEVERIEKQGWKPEELGGLPPVQARRASLAAAGSS